MFGKVNKKKLLKRVAFTDNQIIFKMKSLFISLIAFLLTGFASIAQNVLVEKDNVERIIKTLAADDMEGRRTFTKGNDKAADFIAQEFKAIGLQPLKGADGYLQRFKMYQTKVAEASVSINGKTFSPETIGISSSNESIDWTEKQNPEVNVITVAAGENLYQKFTVLRRSPKNLLVLVDSSHAKLFNSLRGFFRNGTDSYTKNAGKSQVWVLGGSTAESYAIKAKKIGRAHV